ncbi:hypothetical protein NDU88_006380 [Pleurodeles waltl]|uniref:Uncharacterized protein n=1 Tax=Pleurodeles waltl TaxID=8319 RepID=A0AAV7WXG0_PLEWA|nr:hypothetical protein NDU88_006380 [Pleurodeles waltl]
MSARRAPCSRGLECRRAACGERPVGPRGTGGTGSGAAWQVTAPGAGGLSRTDRVRRDARGVEGVPWARRSDEGPNLEPKSGPPIK